MIQKPPGDWQRGATPLANALESATSMARGSARIARTGGHTARGLLCWGLASLWGFAALAAGAAGSLPTFVGVGLMAAGMAWAGNRAFAKARAVLTDARTPEQTSADAAREMRYSRLKLGQSMSGGVILTWAGSFLIHSVGGMTLLLIEIGMVGGAVFSILSGLKLCGDRLALRWDDHAITVGTLFKRRTIRRDDLGTIKLSTVTTYTLGVVCTGRITTLKIGTRNAGSLGVLTGLLELDDRTAADLAAELDRWRSRAAPGATAAATLVSDKANTARRSAIVAPERETAFDADAIRARSLAGDGKVEAFAQLGPLLPERAPRVSPQQRPFGRRGG